MCEKIGELFSATVVQHTRRGAYMQECAHLWSSHGVREKNVLICSDLIDNFGTVRNGFSIPYAQAIISRGLYIVYPISKDHFFFFKEVFSENSVLMFGLYS